MNCVISKRSRLLAFIMFLLCVLGTETPFTAYAQTKQPKLNVSNVTMLQNQTYTVQVYCLNQNQTVSFSIQDESIAYITNTTKKTCTFKTVAVGKTKLTATIYKKEKKVKTLKCSIRVTPPAVSVRFKKKSLCLGIGESVDFRMLVTLKPSNTAEVPVFTTSNSNCLRVTPNGFATGVSPATVTVTATIANGKSDQITIHIKDKTKKQKQ